MYLGKRLDSRLSDKENLHIQLVEHGLRAGFTNPYQFKDLCYENLRVEGDSHCIDVMLSNQKLLNRELTTLTVSLPSLSDVFELDGKHEPYLSEGWNEDKAAGYYKNVLVTLMASKGIIPELHIRDLIVYREKSLDDYYLVAEYESYALGTIAKWLLPELPNHIEPSPYRITEVAQAQLNDTY